MQGVCCVVLCFKREGGFASMRLLGKIRTVVIAS